MAKLSNAPPALVSTRTRAGRQALKEKTNLPKPAGDKSGSKARGPAKTTRLYSGRSDGEDEEPEEEVGIATDSVEDRANADESENVNLPTTRSITSTLETNNKAPRVRAGRLGRKPRHALRNETQDGPRTDVMANVRKRMECTARVQRLNTRTIPEPRVATAAASKFTSPEQLLSENKSLESEPLDLSLSSSPPPANILDSARQTASSMIHAGTFLRAQGTPAIESSILALRNFKRRPRQPSMLQMVQQMTASARPSLVHAPEFETENILDLDVNSDEDDFAPEAEGTPLQIDKSRQSANLYPHYPNISTSQAANVLSQEKSGRKRKSDESISLRIQPRKRARVPQASMKANSKAGSESNVDEENPGLDRSVSPQIQELSEIPVASSLPVAPGSDPRPRTRHHQPLDVDIEVPSTDKTQPAEHENVLPNDRTGENGDQVPNGTMAEPLSSSPLRDYQLHHRQEKQQTAARKQPARTRLNKSKQNSKALSTETLKAMLPRRRKAPREPESKSEYDIDLALTQEDSHVPRYSKHGEDDSSGKPRRQTKTAGKRTTTKNTRQGKAAIPSSRKALATQTRKPSAPSVKHPAVKTYGRTTTSDRENEGDESFEEADESTLPEISLTMHEAAKSKELEEAKRKFAEIDAWDMEMESMSAGNHGSSSPGWR